MPRPIPPQVSLRALREALNLDSRQLAEKIKEQGVDVHPDTLLNVELGHKRASERLMLAWARALGIKRHHIRQGDEFLEWLAVEEHRSAA
jgi:transcriptional regulator with XRE-family HTH domain